MITKIKQTLIKYPWLQSVIIAVVVTIAFLSYILWLKYSTPPATPGDITISALPAKEIVKMETKIIYVPKVVVVKEKAEAVAKLGLPASEAQNPKEALLTANAISANRYGATSAVFLNVSSGLSRVDIVYKKAPWFSFQRSNTVGIEVGYGIKGRYVQADAEHEFAQVKGNYIALKGTGTFYETPDSHTANDLRIGVRVQRHFDWP